MSDLIYDKAMAQLLGGLIDLDTDTIKVALVTSAYVPDAAAHNFFSDITNEVSGTGYTAGGATLTTPVISESAGTAAFDAADVTWPASTITARGAVIYKDTGVTTTSPLIAYIDFVTDKSSSNGDFTIQWNASGILQLS